MRLICAITGDTATIPSAWTAWRIGTLHFERSRTLQHADTGEPVVRWRESGSQRWRALPAIQRSRERIERPRRSA